LYRVIAKENDRDKIISFKCKAISQKYLENAKINIRTINSKDTIKQLFKTFERKPENRIAKLAV